MIGLLLVVPKLVGETRALDNIHHEMTPVVLL
jgi:hypothetical protein